MATTNTCLHCGHSWASHGDGVEAICWRCSDQGRVDYRHRCETAAEVANERAYMERKAARLAVTA